jgi:stearoyl-CoA desaturase (delta-9 desaturase)
MSDILDSVVLEGTTSPRPSQRRIIIENADLQALQKRFALATVLIPLFGTIAAILLTWQRGIGSLPVQLGIFLSLYSLTIIGVTVGFHRHFAHKAFEAKPAVRIALGILGSMAAQGNLIYWIASHRRHHQYSEQPEDPHSPYIFESQTLGWWHGLWHSHLGWMLNSKMTNTAFFAKDLLQEPAIVKVNQLYLVWVGLGLFIPAILGGLLTQTWFGALQGFLWGGMVRLFLVHHFMWTSGSTAHIFGNRPLNTDDMSTNNVWLAIPNFGEAWHNNHHAFPQSAMFGLEPWQLDLGGGVIRGLEKFGWVWNVKSPSRAAIEAKKHSFQ